MRSRNYGLQAADAGCIGICWPNTKPNMSAWGGENQRIGNNSLIFAIPCSNGQHAVIDYAMSQFSCGKVEDYRLEGLQLPVPDGYDTSGQITRDPDEIYKTERVLPMGSWEGSGISITLDMVASALTAENAVHTVGIFEDEIGLSQMMIAIDPSKINTKEQTDAIVDGILAYIKASKSTDEAKPVLYPDEPEWRTMEKHRKNGVPVIEEKWNKVLAM